MKRVLIAFPVRDRDLAKDICDRLNEEAQKRKAPVRGRVVFELDLRR